MFGHLKVQTNLNNKTDICGEETKVTNLQQGTYAPINVKPLGGRPGIGGEFDSSHCPVVGTFDRLNGLSSNILLTFSCYFDIPQMP